MAASTAISPIGRLERITVRTVAVPISPLALAVYGVVAIGPLLAAFGLAIGVLSRFDAV